MTFYQPHHEQQTAAGNSAITRSSGCTWTSGATGADAATGGHKDRTPDYVHSLVKRDEEQNPGTPGWSLYDLDRAMFRLGVPFDVRSGSGWPAVVAAHKAGLYVVLQGDSDRFGNHTCSGAFDGDHCIGIRPGGTTSWPIDDPICPTVRAEEVKTLFEYARKFDKGIRWGVFTVKVPVTVTGWSASISPIPPAEERRFFTYTVRNPRQRPLLVDTRQANDTGGFTANCGAPVRCIAGEFEGTLPAALVRLTTGARKGQYIDGRFAVET